MSAIPTHRPWSRLRASPNSQFAFGLTRHTRWEIPDRRRAPSAGSPSRDSFLSATRRVSILANQCWGSPVNPSCRWRKEPQARCRRLCRRWWARLWKWNSNIIVSNWWIEQAELSAGAAWKSNPSTLFILHLKSYQVASTYAEPPAAKRNLRSVFIDSAGEGLWNLICLQKTWLRLFMLPRELHSARGLARDESIRAGKWSKTSMNVRVPNRAWLDGNRSRWRCVWSGQNRLILVWDGFF